MAQNHCITPELTVADIENFFSLSIEKQPVLKQLPTGSYKGQCYNPDPEKNNPVVQTTSLQDKFELLDECDDDDDDEEDDVITSMNTFGLVSDNLMNLEVSTVAGANPLANTGIGVDVRKLAVYDNYDFNHEYDSELPINAHKTEILEMITGFPVTIIQGATGSGKTTQVPQFILDEAASARKHCNIVITQPRKIAAISIAKRVCEERGWEIGYVVGYHVGLDKKTSEDTRITYVTTGVLLRQLISAKNMHNFTHVILDEVHERDQDTDFAMLLVRKLLWLNSPQVKVLLMSATLETEVFADYFGSPVAGLDFPAPQLTVDGRMFSVDVNYVEQLGLGEVPIFDVNNPEISDEMYLIAAKLILHLDKIEEDEQTTAPPGDHFRGSVLVFLPGFFQIREMEERLNYHRVAKKLSIIPLHSSITLDEQYLVFKKSKPGYRKVILSTNIAESSITVPDIKYVIDFCLTKAMVCDLATNYRSLRLQWASKASGKQRAGRAGRVSNGKVYRMVKKDFWEYHLDEYALPEMQRCSLESVVLKVKMLNLGNPKSILSLALSPPDLHNIERTILLLKEIGALSTTANNKRFDGELTFIGTVLAALPIDMHLGKLVMLGYCFGCFSDCLIIAAALSKPSFFATPYLQRLEAYKKSLEWAQGSFSDSIAMLNAYKEWFRCSQQQRFLRSSDEKKWCKENFLQYRRIREVYHQVEELRDRLRQFNIFSDDGDYWCEKESSEERQMILKIVMAGAFYPNYFLQTVSDEAAAVKQMSQLDPSRTIMFQGLPCGKGFLYKDALLKLTASCGKQKAIYYDGSKAFIEFEATNNIDTGTVLPAVYVASKLHMVKKKFDIHQTYAEIERDPGSHKQPTFLYEPLITETHRSEVPKPGGPVIFSIQVTHVVSATTLWANKLLPRNVELITKLSDTIHNEASRRLSAGEISVGDLVLAPFDDGNIVDYYRAVITRLQPSIAVWFVDYGNAADDLKVGDLRNIPESLKAIPHQAIEFRLRGLRRNESVPAENSKMFLHSLLEADGHVVRARVYSVTSDVVCVDLLTLNGLYINEFLLQKQYCLPADEGKVSEISHSSWLLAAEHEVTDEQTFVQRFSNQWTKVDETMRGNKIAAGSGRYCSVYAPRTMYEESFRSCINIGRMRNVNVDGTSINSVCMNQNSSNPMQTMMVAGEVGINQTGTTMLARNTTLLPNIKGLYQFITLLFAPVAEFRVNEDQTYITGAICGLGAAESKRGLLSVLPDHDLEILFDTELSHEDILDINKIRMAINIMAGSESGKGIWGAGVIHRMQEKARQDVLSLLAKNRPGIEPKPTNRPYTWGLLPPEFIVDHGVQDKIANLKDFYRLHGGILLRDKILGFT